MISNTFLDEVPTIFSPIVPNGNQLVITDQYKIPQEESQEEEQIPSLFLVLDDPVIDQEEESQEEEIAQTELGKQMVSYLKEKYNFTNIQAIAAIKVFGAESGLKAGILNEDEVKKYGNNAGRGLGQWSNSRRRDYEKWMSDNNKNYSWQDDLDYFVQDANKRPAFITAFKNAKSINEAIDAMYYGYENGSRNNLATRELIQSVYSKAYQRLGYKPFDIQKSLDKRYNYVI